MVKHWSARFEMDTVNHEVLIKSYDARMVDTMKKDVSMMEGAIEALQFFKEKQLPIALATCSSDAHIDATMEKHGLRNYFDLLLSAADKMPGKPHPEIYLKTARMLNSDPTCCLAIEDSFFGVIAAKSARMKVVAMPDPLEFDQPRYGAADLKIRSLREINDVTFDLLQKV